MLRILSGTAPDAAPTRLWYVASLKANLVANFAGQGWIAVLQLAFVPIYIRLLGIEGYGLIGFFVMIQTLLRMLDFGLGHTVNREMARYSVAPESAAESRDFLRSAEIVYWVLGVVVGVLMFALAPQIAGGMINAKTLSRDTITVSVALMGFIAALQWPMSAYMGGLQGLQKQVTLNIIKVVSATVASVGGALLLWLVSSDIRLFFWWQLFVTILGIAVSQRLAWGALPQSTRRARFEWQLLRRNWRFAAGISGITVTALVMTQADKWILVKLVDLESFGYYMLAVTFANAVYLLVTPIFSAVYPRYAALASLKDEADLARQYHLGAQLMTCLLAPVGLMLAFFAPEIILIWTRSSPMAQGAATAASLLVLGNTLNGFMNLPYALQLAHGWTGLALRINLLLVAVFLPLVFYLTTVYSVVGAALAWTLISMLYMVLGVPLTHRRLLKNEQSGWWLQDTIMPLLVVLAILTPARLVFSPDWHALTQLAALALTLGVCMTLTVAVCRNLRGAAVEHLREWKTRAGALRFPGKPTGK